MAEANSFTLSSSFLKQVYLYDWWLIKVEIGDGSKRLGIGGFTAKEKPDGRVFHSTTIAKRQDTATLVTVDGTTILLSGFINRCRTLQNGFSSEVCQQFLLGFPYNWEESAAVSFGESTNENAASVISDFSESANTSTDCTSSSSTMSVDHLPANVLRDLLISGAGDPEGGMLRKSIFNEIVQKYGNNAFNIDKASSLNQKSGNQVTPQSPSLNGSPSQKKKAKTIRKQEDSYIPDAKSGKEDLPEATPKDMPEKRFLDRLLHRSGDDVPTAGENSCLNQKSGNQVTSRGPSLDEPPSKKKKTAANLRKEDDNHVPDAQCRKEVLQKCNDESGTDIDKNSSSSSPLIRDKASLYKKTKVHQTQEEKRAVHKVSGQGDFGIVNTTNSSNGPLTRSRAKKKWLKEQGQEGNRYL
ncbi:kinetochore-associated protein KNL-2 homolog [Solanum stenotomum]|uniref:kinetochore-associated protein KNL-2 homolog n=1 Tax=Solanum stenotomum TaxID=172797 RepID=UPI0020D0E860|nr:kinetochore-associated protein KNL-2 homolog [Solanum stenotomum]